jgi:hypothetical protein
MADCRPRLRPAVSAAPASNRLGSKVLDLLQRVLGSRFH